MDSCTIKPGHFTEAGEYVPPDFFEKIKINLVEYRKGQPGKGRAFVHYMELDAFLLVAKDIAEKFIKTDPYQVKANPSEPNKPYCYQEFKGGPDPKSPTKFVSRVLRITTGPRVGAAQALM